MKLHAFMPKIAGKTTANLIGDSAYSGSDAADPSNQSIFALVTYEPNLAAGAASMWKILIIYDAVFTEPKFFTTS